MYSDKETEKQLQILENRIKSEYTKAWREARNTCEKYFEQFEKQDAEMRKALENGTYPTLYGVNAGLTPEEHYKQWRIAHIGIGKRWERVRYDLAKRIGEANIVASSYINETTPSIYSLNYNYSAYEIEKNSGATFDIYDENTVKRLIEDKNHTEFRTVKVDPDRDYNWNTKRIQSELISGIVQGKSIKNLTDGFMKVMGSNRSSAIRNARTAVTSAQNGGRQDCYNKAVDMGIKMEKEWISTHDERTRDSHVKLDGVRVAYNQKFPNKLMYPADPEGAPAEVYNCRCTMRAILKTNKQPRTANTVDSYNAWLKSKTINKDEDAIVHSERYNRLKKAIDNLKVEFIKPKKHSKQPTEDSIITNLCGGDRTAGSCASLGLAYIGQKLGIDVLDFRGGESQNFFSNRYNIDEVVKFAGEENVMKAEAKSYLTSGNKLLKMVEDGKEYYFYCGRHASIVRKKEGKLQYLELQSENKSGWQNFDGNPRYTLSTRFGCTSSKFTVTGGMIDIEKFKGSDDFESILGYINTRKDEQKKGIGGYEK